MPALAVCFGKRKHDSGAWGARLRLLTAYYYGRGTGDGGLE